MEEEEFLEVWILMRSWIIPLVKDLKVYTPYFRHSLNPTLRVYMKKTSSWLYTSAE